MGDVVKEVELDYFFLQGKKMCNSTKHDWNCRHNIMDIPVT